MKKEHINEIKAIIILAFGMILFASLISFVPEDLSWYTSYPNVPAQNLIRITGAYLAGTLFFVFGKASYFFVLFLFFWSWNKFTSRELQFNFSKFLGSSVLFCVISSLFGLIGPQDSTSKFERAGFVGLFISDFLSKLFGAGAYLVLVTLGVLSLIITCEFLVTPHFIKIFDVMRGFSGKMKDKIKEQSAVTFSTVKSKVDLKQKLAAKTNSSKLKEDEEGDYEDEESEDEVSLSKDRNNKEKREAKPKIRVAQEPERKPKTSVSAEGPTTPQPAGEYFLPSLDLLDDPPRVSNSKIEDNLMTGAKLLEETLASFGVLASVVDIERGPAITRYELEPAPGVKVQKFTTLSNDIALAMKASTIRIVAPIPGKNRVGIEVPNDASAAVFLKDVLSSDEFRNAKSKLSLALGKDAAGKSMVANLAEMPHLLIAGTTGSGKSVCVNSIVMSILFNASPDEVKFVMVDPKMVELAIYNDIPHLLCPTVTDAKKAAGVLNWVVAEMESRYRTLSKAAAKNIQGYNAKGNNMPYIVVIIDELADLMQVAAKGVESSIMRLAQLSRAVGIHLILATQRPSVNVITGVIKANFPARISFKVASKVDSRTVLDMNGAESLLGKGDMLFMQPGDAKPNRGQGNYVKDEEIHRVLDFIKRQQQPSYDETILNSQKPGAVSGSEEKDEYYDEAVKTVVETNQASVSILQRRLRLGYTRAARLIDMMENNGIVGPYCGSKAREILVDREQWLLENMKGKSNGGEQNKE